MGQAIGPMLTMAVGVALKNVDGPQQRRHHAVILLLIGAKLLGDGIAGL